MSSFHHFEVFWFPLQQYDAQLSENLQTKLHIYISKPLFLLNYSEAQLCTLYPSFLKMHRNVINDHIFAKNNASHLLFEAFRGQWIYLPEYKVSGYFIEQLYIYIYLYIYIQLLDKVSGPFMFRKKNSLTSKCFKPEVTSIIFLLRYCYS